MNKVAEAPKWSEEDVAIAEKLLKASRTFEGSFVATRNNAARSIGYKEGYNAVPEGVRLYISHKGAVARNEKKYNLAREESDLAKARVEHNLEQLRADYSRQYRKDPSFRHAKTHPDEEKDEE